MLVLYTCYLDLAIYSPLLPPLLLVLTRHQTFRLAREESENPSDCQIANLQFDGAQTARLDSPQPAITIAPYSDPRSFGLPNMLQSGSQPQPQGDYFNNISQQPNANPTPDGTRRDSAEASVGLNELQPKAKRIACVLCRKRKLKCDGARPACGSS